MRYYPVCLDLKRKNCLVVGGGKVALRKIKGLLDGGANIKLVAKEVIPELKSIISDKKITYLGAEYKTDYLKDVFLVIGATNDEILNARLSKEANAANILCNIVDQPEKCNFIVPSVVTRGDLTIAISTAGKSPAMAKKLREELENQFGEDYALFLKLLGKLRSYLKKVVPHQKEREAILNKLVNSNLLVYIKEKNVEAVKKEIKKLVPKISDLDKLLNFKQKEKSQNNV